MNATATEEVGSWPNNVYAPSAIPFNNVYPQPKEMTVESIEEFKMAFVAAAKKGSYSQRDGLGDNLKDEFPESWTVKDSGKLAPFLAERGVDLKMANQIEWGFGGRGRKK
ncbi:NADH-dependent flavin oxidoreductase [Neonectria magnoliae]|uniref:NADH-dependent flavin oxidoreductase n=1 Tax=Neonectria magnoliae TaxID=2732573 RepID=A0ABR1HZE0_9HYPO